MTAPPGIAPATQEFRLPWPDNDVSAARFHLMALGMSDNLAMATIERLAGEGIRCIRRYVIGWDERQAVVAMDRTIAAMAPGKRGDLIEARNKVVAHDPRKHDWLVRS